jgi:hypothetical protein
MPGALLLVVVVAVVLLALAHVGRLLVGVQPALQLLGAALLPGRRVPFTLLLA